MIKADELFINNLKRLKEEGSWDKNPRARYEDGEPSFCKFISPVVMQYNITNEEFPITNLRPIAVKRGIKEMLAFYQDQTNTQQGFENRGVNWWSDWMNENGNIGRAYSYNLESHRPYQMKKEIVKIKKRILSKEAYEQKEIGLINEIKESIDGKTHKSEYRAYGDYIIIDRFIKDKRPYYRIQFLDHGFITDIRKDSLDRGQHPINNYARTLCDIGYLGNFKEISNITANENKKLKEIWTKMIRRCYDNTRPSYEDKYVSSEWHSFENFLNDVQSLPQYHLAKENNFEGWHLDKDYYGSNCYSKDTCVFLSAKENIVYRSTQSKPVLVKTKNESFYGLTHIEISERLGVDINKIKKWIKKGENTEKDILFEEIEIENDFVFRYELSRNQLNDLLSNLVVDPFSKRHMLSFYNWANQNKKMLVECAFLTMWTVREVNSTFFLDCTLIQRSSDCGTALHINQSQYVAMQMMIAKHCSYKVGNFTHFVQNMHYYDRHEDSINELLSRTPIDKQPIIQLNVPDGTNFYDITPEDFEIKNYDPIKPQLKFELAI